MFRSLQMLHEVADGVLSISYANVVDIRALYCLLLRQHCLIATNHKWHVRHQFFDLGEVRLHRIPMRAHDRESYNICIQILNHARIIFRGIFFRITQN